MVENNIESKAFKPDYLNRKALAEEWTDALLSTKIKHHLAISVSGDWGTGKTYLANNWHKYLEEQGYFTCYIDAHKKDYAEEPLLVFVEELNANINQYYKTNMSWWWKIRSKIPILKNKVPKFLINSSAFIGGVEFSLVIDAFKILIQGLQKLLSNKIKNNIEYIALYEKYVNNFKEALTNFTCLFDKPVVIFIDELDRSNPRFVIKLIEQLKHIFEIPNLAFILTVNKKELSNTIKGIYGSEMDGYAYYKKFTTHDFTLYPIEQIDEILIKVFIENTINKYDEYNLSNEFIGMSSTLSKILNLSLRDIEQVLDHLYYIKDKVAQEYHKEYLIICFFYRAIYVKDCKLLITCRHEFELFNNNEIKLTEKNNSNISTINNLLENIRKNFYVQYDILTLMSIIITGVDEKNFQQFKQLCPESLHPFLINGLQELDTELQYIYYSIFTDKKLLFKGARVYKDKQILEKIYNIRKNLIQLSILGAKPDEIVFRQIDL